MSDRGRRLDVELVQRGLARSRGQARELLEAGAVRLDGVLVGRPATPVGPSQTLSVTNAGPRWVSRAAFKLEAALEAFAAHGLSPEGKRCLDVGASTGGFTQVLLRHGAREVVALDVGHGQLVDEIAHDPRVVERSGVNVRDATAADLGGRADLVVADLSFISLRLVLPVLVALTEPDGDLVVLVKPQFEVGRERLGRGGLVRCEHQRARVIRQVVADGDAAGLRAQGLLPSPIRGTTGNAEYLLWCTPRAGLGLSPDQVAQLATDHSREGSS